MLASSSAAASNCQGSATTSGLPATCNTTSPSPHPPTAKHSTDHARCPESSTNTTMNSRPGQQARDTTTGSTAASNFVCGLKATQHPQNPNAVPHTCPTVDKTAPTSQNWASPSYPLTAVREGRHRRDAATINMRLAALAASAPQRQTWHQHSLPSSTCPYPVLAPYLDVGAHVTPVLSTQHA